jgi:hypothetical protein
MINKKLIYNIFKYPLILIFLKTPLINLLKKRFKFHRFAKNKNIIMLTLDTLFEREYFAKLKSKEEMRKLSDITLISGEGKKWAERLYSKNFQTPEELKNLKVGSMYGNENLPIFESIIDYIKNNQLEENKNVYIIQLGSCSGTDLIFFYKLFPKLNYISTDVNNEFLDFQKEKYKYPNFKFYVCYAEDIDKCINYFQLENKILILFSRGSLQFVNPYYIKEFFDKINKYNNLNNFIVEPVSLSFIDNSKKMSEHRGNISFSHRYDEYANEAKMKIIKKKIIRPYIESDPQGKDTGHFFLNIKKI